jgi:hypothetical protein
LGSGCKQSASWLSLDSVNGELGHAPAATRKS